MQHSDAEQTQIHEEIVALREQLGYEANKVPESAGIRNNTDQNTTKSNLDSSTSDQSSAHIVEIKCPGDMDASRRLRVKIEDGTKLFLTAPDVEPGTKLRLRVPGNLTAAVSTGANEEVSGSTQAQQTNAAANRVEAELQKVEAELARLKGL